MRYIIILSLFCYTLYGQSGIRSLNGSLLNSQRITLDTTATSNAFSTSNGVHTLGMTFPRIVFSDKANTLSVSVSVPKLVVTDSMRIDELGTPITKAVIDSNALEFTASSVEYRAMQTAYAKLYHDTTTAYTITLGTADSFYTIKNWNQSLGMRKNMTITDSSIVIRVAGVYQVQYALSSASSSANTVLQTSIFQNFSRKSGTSAQQKIATANDIGNMTGLGIMYCNVGDYIQLRVRRASGAGSCEVTEGQLVVTRID